MTNRDTIKDALTTVRGRIDGAVKADAHTAIASLTRLEVSLMRELAQIARDEDDAPPTADEIRTVILSLPDDLAKVAKDALQERRTAGRR